MLNTPSSSGLFGRVSNRLQSTAATNSNGRRKSTFSSSVPQKKKAMEFVLIRNEFNECDDATLKWDSKVAEGMMMVEEDSTEEQVRSKMCEAFYKKFPLITPNDFEFVKVKQKRVTIPDLSGGNEYNYNIVKKMAGQGMIYVQIKKHMSFLLDMVDDNVDDNDVADDNVIAEVPANNSADDVEITAVVDNSVDVITENLEVTDVLEAAVVNISSNENDSSNSDTSRNDPITNLIKYIESNQLMDPVEILRFMQHAMHCGRDLHVSDLTQCIEGDTNFLCIDKRQYTQNNF